MKTGLFGNLLFSAPNHLGGLYACIEDGQILPLDDRGTCGLHWSMHGPFLRGIQLEDRLAITDRNGTREHTGEWGDLHDVLLDGEDVYLVSTQHNAVIRWNIQKEMEIERWVFSGQEDSWHINCLGWLHGALCFAAFGDYPIARGYKLNTSEQGFLRRLHGNTRPPLVSGLSQPHSILEFENQWFFCNSETREIWHATGPEFPRPVIAMDGYTRGLAIRNGVLYVGLSASRNITNGDLQERAQIVAIDVTNWREISRISLPSMEVYDIVALPDTRTFLHLVAQILSGWRIRAPSQQNAIAEKLEICANESAKLKYS
jgi:hypothetical protein